MYMLAAISNLIALLAVLVSGLSIWSGAHLTLRSFGPDQLVFLGVFLLLGVPTFYLVAKLTTRLLMTPDRFVLHICSSIAFYAIACLSLVFIFRHPIQNGAEGGDITLRVVLLLALLGIGTNAMVSIRRQPDV